MTNKSFLPKIVIVLINFLILLVISSCELTTFPVNSEYGNLTAFFREYTEKAAIDKYNKFDYLMNKYDVPCIPSTEDYKITFVMRNPIEFKFDEKHLLLKLPENGVQVDPSMVNIIQDPENINLLHLTYSQEYLYLTDTGLDISPTITLINPKNEMEMQVYQDLKLSSNSPPPAVYKPVVYTYDADGNEEYVLIFNMPSKGLLSSNHKDVSSLQIINTVTNEFNETYNFSINSDGSFKISGSSAEQFTTEQISLDDMKFNVLGATFEERGQAVFVKTGEKITTDDYVYKFIISDKDGLKSESQASVKSVGLYPIIVTDIKDEILNDGDKVEQDDGDSYATVNFTPPEKTYWYVDSETGDVVNRYIWYTDEKGEIHNYQNATQTYTQHSLYLELGENGELLNKSLFPAGVTEEWKLQSADTSNAAITYEIYQGTDDTGKVLFNGKNDGGKLTLRLPSGNLFVRIYAHLTGFADTRTREFGMEVLKSTVYVSEFGNNEDNNGSSNSPFATVTNAVKRLSYQDNEKNKIYLLSDISENIEIKIDEEAEHKVNNVYTTISSSNDEIRVINGDINIADNCTVTLCNIKVNGNIYVASTSRLIFSKNVDVVNGTITLAADEKNSILELEEDFELPKTPIEIIQNPVKLNSVILLSSTGKLPQEIADDLNNDTYRYFVLNNGGYFIFVETSDTESENYMCGTIRKSGITMLPPEFGGLSAILLSENILIESENGVYNLTAGSKVSVNVIKIDSDYSNRRIPGISDVKLTLELEGDEIGKGIPITADNAVAEITLPEIIGNYMLRLEFTYNRVTYSENFIVKINTRGVE